MTVKEYVDQALENLDEVELAKVAEYVSFLRFRARVPTTPSLDAAQLASLYAEFATEDRSMAEEGMEEYAQGLAMEDRQ